MKRLAIFLGVLFQVFVSFPLSAFASPADLINTGLSDANVEAKYTAGVSVSTLVGKLIQVLLGLTGIIFLVIIVFAGFLYLTAAGDGGKVDKAKKMMTQSVIGLIIIVGAYSISTFVIDQLKGAV